MEKHRYRRDPVHADVARYQGQRGYPIQHNHACLGDAMMRIRGPAMDATVITNMDHTRLSLSTIKCAACWVSKEGSAS